MGASRGILLTAIVFWYMKAYLALFHSPFNVLRVAVSALMRTSCDVPQGSVDPIRGLQGFHPTSLCSCSRKEEGTLRDASEMTFLHTFAKVAARG